MKRPFHVKISLMRRVEMWESALWISTFPHAVVVSHQRCAHMGPWPTPGGLLFAFVGDRSDHPAACHAHRRGGAISVTIVDAIRTQIALTLTVSWREPLA